MVLKLDEICQIKPSFRNFDLGEISGIRPQNCRHSGIYGAQQNKYPRLAAPNPTLVSSELLS